MTAEIEGVLGFWFEELEPPQWFEKDLELDAQITERFRTLHGRAVEGALAPWRATAEGRLAEVIVLDQLSRNIFRGTPGAFAADATALERAREAIAVGADMELEPQRRMFLYMPFMHSESVQDQNRAVTLFERLVEGAGDGARELTENYLNYAKQHHDIVARFGRFPHRNAILSRD